MAEWDIETITLRAARDYADQLHFARGAGDDAAAYEEDLGRAKAEITAALAEHDHELLEAAAQGPLRMVFCKKPGCRISQGVRS